MDEHTHARMSNSSHYNTQMQGQPTGAPFDGGHHRSTAMARVAPSFAAAASSASASPATFSPRIAALQPHQHKGAHAAMSAANHAVESLPLLAPVPRSFLNAPRDLPCCHLVSQRFIVQPHARRAGPALLRTTRITRVSTHRLLCLLAVGAVMRRALISFFLLPVVSARSVERHSSRRVAQMPLAFACCCTFLFAHMLFV